MSHYIHHVPGRLRIKTLTLKGNQIAAQEVCRLLSATDGVIDCHVKTVTGSVVISYDAELTDGKSLLELLKERGYVNHAAEVAAPNAGKRTSSNMTQAASSAGSNVGKAVFGFVVEKAVERSAAALIGALL
jgi:hypothetical protein